MTKILYGNIEIIAVHIILYRMKIKKINKLKDKHLIGSRTDKCKLFFSTLVIKIIQIFFEDFLPNHSMPLCHNDNAPQELIPLT